MNKRIAASGNEIGMTKDERVVRMRRHTIWRWFWLLPHQSTEIQQSDVSFPYIETSLLPYQIFQSLFEVFSRLVISQESYLCWVLHQHCRGLETSRTATSLTYCSCAVAAYNTARWRPTLWHCTPRIWCGTVVHSRNSKGRDMNFCTVNAIGLP